MRWFRRDPSRVTPVDSLLTVEADALTDDDGRPAVIAGWLDLTEEGIRWQPAGRRLLASREPFVVTWRQIAGIEGVRIFAHYSPIRTLMSIKVLNGDQVDLSIPTERRDEVAEVLSRFLEQPGPMDQGPSPPFAFP